MKQAILVHGTGGSGTDYFWFADTKAHLESLGYTLWWEELPGTEKPELSETLSFVQQNAPELNNETLLIGHSSACPVILHWLEVQNVVVDKVILVAGYYQDIGGNSAQMLPNSFAWENIESKAKTITMINSNNDPWGCTVQNAKGAALALSADLIRMEGEGHMGSRKFNQPYREFPLVKELATDRTT